MEVDYYGGHMVDHRLEMATRKSYVDAAEHEGGTKL